MQHAYDTVTASPEPEPDRHRSEGGAQRLRAWARRRRPRVVTAMIIVVVGLVGAAGWWWWPRDGQAPPAAPVRLNLEQLPTAQLAVDAEAPPCQAKRTHTHQFPESFVGTVWVHLAAPTAGTGPVTIKLKWGPKTWSEELPLDPGSVITGQGGTFIAFSKDTPQTPGIIFTSSVPVCARFGTAITSPLPAPTTKMEAKGWT